VALSNYPHPPRRYNGAMLPAFGVALGVSAATDIKSSRCRSAAPPRLPHSIACTLVHVPLSAPLPLTLPFLRALQICSLGRRVKHWR
jgi:hypothetical protein